MAILWHKFYACFVLEILPYLAENKWFLIYQSQPVESVQEKNICLL